MEPGERSLGACYVVGGGGTPKEEKGEEEPPFLLLCQLLSVFIALGGEGGERERERRKCKKRKGGKVVEATVSPGQEVFTRLILKISTIPSARCRIIQFLTKVSGQFVQVMGEFSRGKRGRVGGEK